MFDELLNATLGVLAIDSVESEACGDNAPFGSGVRAALDFTLDKARDLGFDTKDGKGYYGVAECGKGELVAVLGHLDTVPIGKDWTASPYGEIVDGYIYGRGVLDDKGPMFACMYAAKELMNEGHVPKKRLRFIFGCDEESGWQCMDSYVANEEIPVFAFTPDGDFPVINCEKGIVYCDVLTELPQGIVALSGGDRANMVMDYVEAIFDGSFVIDPDICAEFGVIVKGNTVTAHGISAHGSAPTKGDNAFFKLIKAMSKCVGGQWARLEQVVVNTDGSGFGIKCHDSVSGELTVNVGLCGIKEGKLHFSMDIRYPISYTQQNIIDNIKSTLDDFDVTAGFYHNSLYVDKEHPLVNTLLDAYQEVVGERLQPIAIGGGTYARALPTAVAFGPIFPWQEATIHQKNERVKVEDFELMYRVYKCAIRKFAFE